MAADSRRPTLRDIAGRAGVHYSAVSLALRGRPGVSEATRERVRRVADELGYRPDALLSALSGYRRERRSVRFRAMLAWMTNFPTRDGWRDEEIYREYFLGAQERAHELGFRLEEFWRREAGMTAARATAILRARGIEGLIVAPQPTPAERIALEWRQFSAVAIGYSLVEPRLHMVCPNQYRCMRRALEELAARGYRRIGAVMLRASDERVENNWMAGYLTAPPAGDRLPPLLLERWDEAKFAAWLRRHRPDAVVSKCAQALPALRRLGRRLPADLGAAFLTGVKPGRGIAGINEAPAEVGAAAVDMLSGMVANGERGIPVAPRRLLIDGQWIEGTTVVAPLARAPRRDPGAHRISPEP